MKKYTAKYKSKIKEIIKKSRSLKECEVNMYWSGFELKPPTGTLKTWYYDIKRLGDFDDTRSHHKKEPQITPDHISLRPIAVTKENELYAEALHRYLLEKALYFVSLLLVFEDES
jgi:hypothetical protein